ncbi:CysZ protein [Rhodoblastus acidophilus]|uniref:CysZ protein n=1 Tax=Rhodoblastus acidophilus TaxID=1074 RepID=A0A212S3Z1_RHOAC|nr:sulfate transporter family protein [Rhodoblastus acidophilus]MCW2315034.1 CysZ protein [Rhodoblastus acidophilus]PPQ37694.1 cysteine biosynthesis protein CysZ [Rhodoblastus acidophilus]RAI23906.1 cysteine biosynthesis protein CysZ [Rhodoblastus acidophilus]SNB79900.1 CysZ protein [Rhodoblastus acidophilus]
MLDDAITSLKEIFTPAFRSVLLKSLGLTFAFLAALWLILDRLALSISAGSISAPWLVLIVKVMTALGLFVGLLFLIAPVSMLVAGFFLDELAEHVETNIYPAGQKGTVAPAMQSIWLAVKFSAVSLLVNLLAFGLWLLPGVNAVIFFMANAYLFSREYFELAALRFHPVAEVRNLRERNSLKIYAAGLILAVFVATPVVNLVTPLFGVAFMVRLHKRLAARPTR